MQLALDGCADDLMRELRVVHVEPAPDATQLRVEVCCPSGDGVINDAVILHRLERLKGFLRAQIAATVVRKRVPELVFTVVATPGGGA